MILKRALFALCIPAVIVLLSVTCSRPLGKGIIPEKKFVDVLADIHLADAIAVDNLNTPVDFRLDSAALYTSVFRKHHVTRAMFDSTMLYYTTKPDEFQRIYDRVLARLKMMEEELKRNEAGAQDSVQESSE